jgi:hypothetical protein
VQEAEGGIETRGHDALVDLGPRQGIAVDHHQLQLVEGRAPGLAARCQRNPYADTGDDSPPVARVLPAFTLRPCLRSRSDRDGFGLAQPPSDRKDKLAESDAERSLRHPGTRASGARTGQPRRQGCPGSLREKDNKGSIP